MNKILKIAAVFVLGIGVLTGCTDKVAQKITNDTEKTQDVTTNMLKDDANVDEQNQQENKDNNVVNKNENQTIAPTNRNNTNKYNHNFNEAGKILELMNYSLLNFKGSTAANAIRYSVIDNGIDNQIVFAPATYVLDLINTYNEGTYNLKDVFTKLYAERGITFMELDKSKVEYTQEELEKLSQSFDEDRLFKREVHQLQKGYEFAVYVTVKEGVQLTGGLVSMGQKGSLFKVSVQKSENNENNLESEITKHFQKHTPKGQTWHYCLSDVCLLNDVTGFAILEEKLVRQLHTDLKENRLKGLSLQGHHLLYKAGSVFYGDDKIPLKSGIEAAGYNVICKIEGSKV